MTNQAPGTQSPDNNDDLSNVPTGQGEYVVQPGESVESIAFTHGLFWETVWNDPQNADLKNARKNPNVLLAGDKLHLPEKQIKKVSGATEKRHSFRRKGVPSRIELVFLDKKENPRANVRYVLDIDNVLTSGMTDSNGRINHPVPPDAKSGKVTLIDEKTTEVHPLNFGGLDPLDAASGVQQRLKNLGYPWGKTLGLLDEDTEQGLKEFQDQFGLEITGKPDQNTRKKLQEIFGS